MSTDARGPGTAGSPAFVEPVPPSAADDPPADGHGPPDVPEPRALTHPSEGVPDVVTRPTELRRVVAAFAAGTGPVAVDAERASGYRYGQRAYLVQLRRAGAGTALVDPVALPDLSDLGDALADAEWVLHAANQDIPCLTEVGMRPPRIFDTELAGRLLDYPRVGLGPLVETVLGLRLEKGHSAADWSTRPLPEPWLRYAALDVEVLVDLRDVLHAELQEAGKLDWALEEFAAVAEAPTPEPRTDPWRRTSGLHRVRDRRRLAVVRELWRERDGRARARDLSPGRVLPDSAIVDAALSDVSTAEELAALPVFRGRAQRRDADRWFAAVSRARSLPERDLPPVTLRYDGPPPARAWPDRDPVAAARLAAAREAVTAVAEAHMLPVENLLAPETLRRVAWDPPDPADEESVAAAMSARGARAWQVSLTAGPVAAAFRSAG